MTTRRERNKDARRAVVEQFADDYRCPDCFAEKQLASRDGIYVLEVRHDPTCPTFLAMERP
jgi:hypothetical protein